MRFTSLWALLTAVFLLTSPGLSSATPPDLGGYGHKYGAVFNWFPCIHQHGPLFNYGPYYGYPPFAPYGPWNAYLQYNPWYFGVPGGKQCCGDLGDLSGHGGLCKGGHGFGLGGHTFWGGGGWNHGCATCGHGGLFTGQGGWVPGNASGGCTTCSPGVPVSSVGTAAPVAFNSETTDPMTRYAGAGNPVDFAGFYVGLPTLAPTVTPAGGVAK